MGFQAGWYKFGNRDPGVTSMPLVNTNSDAVIFIDRESEYLYWIGKGYDAQRVLVLTPEEFEDMLESRLQSEEFEI